MIIIIFRELIKEEKRVNSWKCFAVQIILKISYIRIIKEN